MARRKPQKVGIDQIVPGAPNTDVLHTVGVRPPFDSGIGSLNGPGPVPQPDSGDDYWARALGKASAPQSTRQFSCVGSHRSMVVDTGVLNVTARAATATRWRHSRWVVAAGAALALAAGLGGGGAYAYLTSQGSGTGHATAGTLQAVSVQAATVSPSTPLSPGVTGDVVLTVSNPNAFQVSLVSVSYGAITAVGGTGTCTTTGITLNAPTNLPLTINASGTTSVDLLGAATMGSTSQTGCQGATFSIPVTITVNK